MSEQELIFKTNQELAALADELYSKINGTWKQIKTSSKRPEYFEDLQTVIRIIKEGKE